jgi:glutaredoxin-like protein NrdH
MERMHVDGDNRGDIMLYTLSTCGWCKRTKALLRELNVMYDFVEVDTLDKKEERDAAMEAVKKWNPACSFPSLVIDNKECLVGFQEQKLREKFGA